MRKENRVAHGSVKDDEGRIGWLDVAKGLSILLVVFHHAAQTGASIGSVAKIVKLEHAWRRLDGRNDDGFQVAPFPG
ncbi:hypothetical protein [Sphingobium sp. HDIP04]|uniref:hypothetical protein n=1 Tax=Sphingobium sp. HDIP04 TaxID=428994 RepID=UPI0004040F2D|nr:hypothetical protein [Sphingobium sp. HDIP04]